jgi:hypothetical protein
VDQAAALLSRRGRCLLALELLAGLLLGLVLALVLLALARLLVRRRRLGLGLLLGRLAAAHAGRTARPEQCVEVEALAQRRDLAAAAATTTTSAAAAGGGHGDGGAEGAGKSGHVFPALFAAGGLLLLIRLGRLLPAA